MRKYKANGGYRVSMSSEEFEALRERSSILYVAVVTFVVGAIVGVLL